MRGTQFAELSVFVAPESGNAGRTGYADIQRTRHIAVNSGRCRFAGLPLSTPHCTGIAPVAQLDRALPSEGRGQGFESLRARQ